MKDVFKKSVYGIGYLGLGCYKTRFDNKSTKQYITWKNMMFRCYGHKRLEKFPSYLDCYVCDEWHNFQNFANWFDGNYINGYHLDKDLLFKGNKIYSPEKCIFIPQEINKLLTKTDSKRGEYPIGVFYNKNISKYTSQVCVGFKIRKFLGNFDNCNDAFYAYKKEKEQLIKKSAIHYYSTGKISLKVYNSLQDYTVNITD